MLTTTASTASLFAPDPTEFSPIVIMSAAGVLAIIFFFTFLNLKRGNYDGAETLVASFLAVGLASAVFLVGSSIVEGTKRKEGTDTRQQQFIAWLTEEHPDLELTNHAQELLAEESVVSSATNLTYRLIPAPEGIRGYELVSVVGSDQ